MKDKTSFRTITIAAFAMLSVAYFRIMDYHKTFIIIYGIVMFVLLSAFIIKDHLK
jgi:hypothetical protein